MASFMAPAAQIPDPLADVEYTGDLEKDSAAELDAVAKGWRDRRDREETRFLDAVDSEFWFAVCFRTRAHKDAFIEAMKIGALGDKYIDGHKLARMLGLDIEGDGASE